MIPEKHHELHRRKDPKNDKKPHLLLILEFFKDEVNRDSLQGRVSLVEEMENKHPAFTYQKLALRDSSFDIIIY